MQAINGVKLFAVIRAIPSNLLWIVCMEGEKSLYQEDPSARNNFSIALNSNAAFGFTIDQFTLLSASWVIRAAWREIERICMEIQSKIKCTRLLFRLSPS